MASVIIITYGQRRHLIHKPNNYDSLLDIAFEKFPELEDVDDRDIAFNFTPEWFNGEVQVDRSAFSEVHARAILRITTTAVVHRGNDVKVKHEQVVWVVHGFTARNGAYHFVPRMKVLRIMHDAATDLDFDFDESYFTFRGADLVLNDKPQDIGMEPEDDMAKEGEKKREN